MTPFQVKKYEALLIKAKRINLSTEDNTELNRLGAIRLKAMARRHLWDGRTIKLNANERRRRGQ